MVGGKNLVIWWLINMKNINNGVGRPKKTFTVAWGGVFSTGSVINWNLYCILKQRITILDSWVANLS